MILNQSSTRNTAIWRGPKTPCTISCSMSYDREVPVRITAWLAPLPICLLRRCMASFSPTTIWSARAMTKRMSGLV